PPLRLTGGPAVEDESQPAWAVCPCWPEVDANEQAACEREPAFFPCLAPAGLPRPLVRLDLAAWDRPALLVGRLQDQQPLALVADQCAGGGRESRDFVRHCAAACRCRSASSTDAKSGIVAGTSVSTIG